MDRPDAALVAGILSGAWRASPPPCDLTPDEIDRVTPLLTLCGCTGLGWWRVKDTPLAPHAATLRGSAQLLALDDSVRQTALSELCALLNGAGVTPMLFKGWAAGLSYPQGWLRPYGDFDLLVRSDDFVKARAVLASAATRSGSGNDFAMPLGPRGHCSVDLHDRLDDHYAADNDTLFHRALRITLPGGHLLVPSAEDHLRLCAMHMFRHGAWRPLWLCDVAAIIEATDAAFDWDACLSDRPVTAAWTAASLMLANRLLGARIDHVPARVFDQCLPDWLEQAVLRHWAYPHAGRFMAPAPFSLRDPAAMKRRWPDAVTATLAGGGLPQPGVRLPWQLRHYTLTLARGLGRRIRRVWQRRP